LLELAEQVIRSVDQRSRLVRRHARRLAEAVLVESPPPRHWLPVAADLAVLVTEQSDVGESFVAFAGVA